MAVSDDIPAVVAACQAAGVGDDRPGTIEEVMSPISPKLARNYLYRMWFRPFTSMSVPIILKKIWRS